MDISLILVGLTVFTIAIVILMVLFMSIQRVQMVNSLYLRITAISQFMLCVLAITNQDSLSQLLLMAVTLHP